MKRVLLLVLSFVLIACIASGLVACNTGVKDTTDNGLGTDVDAVTENILYRLEEDGSGAVVVGIGGGFNGERVVLPEKATIEGKEYPIVGIGEKALQNFDTVKSVKLPATLKRIEDSAFFDCDLLESIEIPEGVTEIGKDAFMKCKSLKSVSLPESLTSIGAKCFSECVSLESITLPGCIKTLEEGVFNNCTSLVSCNLNAVETIGKYAFSGCTAFTDITLPESVASVQEGAFAYCTEIAIDIKNTDVVFAEQVFSDEVSLELSLPEFKAIQGISSKIIKKVTAVYDNDVLTIGNYEDGLAVEKAECTGTLDLNIDLSYLNSNGIKKISDNAFKDNTKLTGITIPDSIASIGKAAFFGCNSLATVTIGKGVTSIGEIAFRDCSFLTNITIPDSVTSIGLSAFSGCGSLESISLPFVGGDANADEASESTLFGHIFGTENYEGGVAAIQKYAPEESIKYYIPGKLKNVVITGGNILQGAFSSCNIIASITIPDSVTNICAEVFSGCSSLAYITIPQGVSTIGKDAFKDCSTLADIIIPDNVTSIESGAFKDCISLTSMIIPDSVTRIGYSVFSGCSSLESITLPFVGAKAGVTSSYIYQYPLGYIFGRDPYQGGEATEQYYYGSSTSSTQSTIYYIPAKLKDLTVTGGNILYGVFSNCRSLTSITIPDCITSIGSSAFSGCSSLPSMIIPDSVISIGDGAFSCCSSLASIMIPDSVTSIGGAAFEYCGSLKNIELPNSVTEIGKEAFSNNDKLTVSLKYGREQIEEGLFEGTGLSNINIPDSVTSIGKNAFSNCSLLKTIDIPDSVISIGESAFSGCISLKSMSLPFIGAKVGVTSSDMYQYPLGYVFGTTSYKGGQATEQYYYGSSVSSTTSSIYYIPSSLESLIVKGGNILYGAFYNCCSLKIVNIGKDVITICDQVFVNCSSLENITVADGNYVYHDNGNCIIETKSKILIAGCKSSVIPDDGSVTSIGSFAFYYCRSIINITIPDSVTSIGYNAFSGNNRLTVSLEDGRKHIEEGLFQETGIANIIIPDSVISIGDYAFKHCGSLKNLELPNSVTEIGKDAFSNNDKLTVSLKYGREQIEEGLFEGTGLSNINIPDSVTSIGKNAFSNCSLLKTIDIPDSVISIGEEAFSGCSSLESITLPFVGAKAGVTSNDKNQYPLGYIFGTAQYQGGEATEQYYYGLSTISMQRTTYYIPAKLKNVTVTGGNILYGAFYNCNSLINITISDSVKSIGMAAFSGCSSLESITLPFVGAKAGVTSNDKNQYPLGYIFGTAQYQGGEATEQYYYASTTDFTQSTTFYIPSCLKNVTVTRGNILCGAFYNCSSIATITIPVGVTSIGDNAFYGCSSLTSITIPSGVTSIGEGAFCRCSSLTSITISDSVISIGDSAFYGCSSLTSIAIPDSVKYIDKYVFTGCSLLASITIPNGMKSIEDGVFSACKSLKSITIPDSVTSIGAFAFEGCSSLASITIPDSVTSIGYSAFLKCRSFTSITIPKSVNNIGSNAFADCSSLISVKFENKDDWWRSTSSSATSGTSIPWFDLLDYSKAAQYLTDTYSDYYWKRS